MKRVATVMPFFAATPALAHHEVVVSASMVPLAAGMATITIAALTAWRRWRKDRRK